MFNVCLHCGRNKVASFEFLYSWFLSMSFTSDQEVDHHHVQTPMMSPSNQRRALLYSPKFVDLSCSMSCLHCGRNKVASFEFLYSWFLSMSFTSDQEVDHHHVRHRWCRLQTKEEHCLALNLLICHVQCLLGTVEEIKYSPTSVIRDRRISG